MTAPASTMVALEPEQELESTGERIVQCVWVWSTGERIVQCGCGLLGEDSPMWVVYWERIVQCGCGLLGEDSPMWVWSTGRG